MRITAALPVLATLAASVHAASQSFFGTNLYYLQGLPDAKQDDYINTMASQGIKVIRVWVNSQGQGCQKGSYLTQAVPAFETTIRSYNYQTLDALDKVINKIAKAGMKVVISPHDGNSLIGDYRKDAYYNKYGGGYFYEQQAAFDDYDARLSAILNYKGKYSGQVWKNWNSAILSFNLQNEPMSVDNHKACKAGDPHGWACGRARHLRSELGADNPILVSTGALGGDFSWGCTFLEAATTCDAIDVISVHRYAGFPGHWSSAAPSWIQQSNGKLVYLEEWGIDTSENDIGSAFTSDTNDLNSFAMPNLYWQILPPKDDQCSDYDPANDDGDKFGIFMDGPAKIGNAASGAIRGQAKQDWSAAFRR